MSYLKRILFTGLILSIMMAAGNAFATSRVYSGNECVPVGADATGLFYDYSAVYNTNGYSLTVICPAINVTQTNIQSAWVMVKDQNNNASNSSVHCALGTVYRAVGGTQYYSVSYAETSTTGWSSNWQELDFGNLYCGSRSGIYLNCTLPGNDVGYSYIAEYKITQ